MTKYIRPILILICICAGSVRAEDAVLDCTNEDIVTTIFNDPIDLTLNGTIRVYEHIAINALMSTSNNEFEKNYIDARLEAATADNSTNLVIYTTEYFGRYATEQSAGRIILKIVFGCDMGRERTLVFYQPILEGNYFSPKFSQDVYELTMPAPIFSGFDLTAFIEVSARDDDLTANQLAFTSDNSAEHHIRVGTKNLTSADRKTFFAEIKLQRIFLALANEFSFRIIATDNGVPPLSSTATVVVRADPENTLPPTPQFEQLLYFADLKLDLTLEPFTVALRPETYSTQITFSAAGENGELFALRSHENAVEITLASNLNRTDTTGRQYLYLQIRAEHQRLAEFGKAAVLVRLPSPKEYIKFARPLYNGSINVAGALHIDEIIFEPLAYRDDLTFSLNGTYANYFTLEIVGHVVKLALTGALPAEVLANESSLLLEIEATLTSDDVKAAVAICISTPRQKAPTAEVRPVFEKSLYVGRVTPAHELLIEAISLRLETYLPNRTQFVVSGNENDIFIVLLLDNSVQLMLKRMPNTEDLQDSPTLYLTITASNGAASRAQAIVAIETVVNIWSSGRIFQSSWLLGKLDGYGETDAQALHVDALILRANYTVNDFVFAVVGDESGAFSLVGEADDHKLLLLMKQPLAGEAVANKTLLQVEVHGKRTSDPTFNDSLLVLIELPRAECVPENSSATALPVFSSKEYVFAAQPNQIGIVGAVSATIRDANAVLQYNILVEDEYLQRRIAINTYTGELMLLSYVSPGIYGFRILAENVVTLANSSAAARLDVSAMLQCERQEVAVANSLLVKRILEEEPHTDLLNMTMGDCSFFIVSFTPNDQEYVYVNETTKMLSTISIDREAAIFANMTVPQISVKLKLACDRFRANATLWLGTRAGIAAEEADYAVQTNDIPYADDVTWLTLVIADVNDNAPEFERVRAPTYLGYPESTICFELFPQYLTQVRATDRDQGANAEIRYSMRPNQHFDIDALTGVIYPKANALKTTASTELLVVATDGAGRESDANRRTATVLLVRRLSADYFSLLTFKGSERRSLDDLLQELTTETGYKIMLVKQATLPENDTAVGAARLTTAQAGGDQLVVQKAWAYAFDRDEPVRCTEFKRKIVSLPHVSASLTLESFAESGLTATAPQEAAFAQQQAYMIAIVTLAVCSLTCAGYLLWHLYVRKRFCAHSGGDSDCDDDGASSDTDCPIAVEKGSKIAAGSDRWPSHGHGHGDARAFDSAANLVDAYTARSTDLDSPTHSCSTINVEHHVDAGEGKQPNERA